MWLILKELLNIAEKMAHYPHNHITLVQYSQEEFIIFKFDFACRGSSCPLVIFHFAISH